MWHVRYLNYIYSRYVAAKITMIQGIYSLLLLLVIYCASSSRSDLISAKGVPAHIVPFDPDFDTRREPRQHPTMDRCRQHAKADTLPWHLIFAECSIKHFMCGWIYQWEDPWFIRSAL